MQHLQRLAAFTRARCHSYREGSLPIYCVLTNYVLLSTALKRI